MRILHSMLVFLASCAVDPDARPAPRRFEPTPLPDQWTDADCRPAGPPPTLCAWAERSEAIVLARLVTIEWVTTPSVAMTTGKFSDGGCYGWANPAIRLEVTVEAVLSGQADLGRLTVRVGNVQTQSWAPAVGQSPILGQGGQIRWGMPRPGGSLLLAITHETARGEWSLIGEPLRTFEPDGTVAAVNPPCGDQPMELEGGLSYNALAAALKACVVDPTRSDAPALLAKRAWSAAPQVGLAAVCFE